MAQIFLIATLALLPHLWHEVAGGQECTLACSKPTATVFTLDPLCVPSGETWASPCHLHTWDLKMFSPGPGFPLEHFSRVPPQSRGKSRKSHRRRHPAESRTPRCWAPEPAQMHLVSWGESRHPEGQGSGLSRCVRKLSRLPPWSPANTGGAGTHWQRGP